MVVESHREASLRSKMRIGEKPGPRDHNFEVIV
jgi:hypothetical protein